MGKKSSNSGLKSLDTFLLPDQIIQSQIENEFLRLFSPSNMTAHRIWLQNLSRDTKSLTS
jgi:hypothetical protein